MKSLDPDSPPVRQVDPLSGDIYLFIIRYLFNIEP